MSYLYLLQLIDILSLLDVQLEDVKDSSVDIQHSFRDTSWSEYFSDNTVGIFKLDGCRELSSQGRSYLGSWGEIIFGPEATVLQDFRLLKLQGT